MTAQEKLNKQNALLFTQIAIIRKECATSKGCLDVVERATGKRPSSMLYVLLRDLDQYIIRLAKLAVKSS